MFRNDAGIPRKIAVRRPTGLAVAGALCAACHAAPPSPTTPLVAQSAAPAWTYEVAVAPALDLHVVASFAGPLGSELAVDEDAEPFIDQLELHEGGIFRPIERKDGHLRDACRAACQLRYRVRLRDAAVAIGDTDVALLAGGALFAPPSTWLLHPDATGGKERFRFHVSLPPGVTFETGVRPVRGARDTYEAGTGTFDESTFSAFGALRTARLEGVEGDEGGIAEVVVAPEVALPDDAIARWIGTGLRAISTYMGRFPEDRVVLFVAPGTSEAMRGKTFGGGGASVLLRLSNGATEATLADDWVAPHELIHVGSPSLARTHRWMGEGLASYAEPIARVELGLITPEKVWGDLIDGLPQGLPEPSDRGLDLDDSWGRVYWGGALYFLLADLEIRQATSDGHSLRDAIRAIAATGANVETAWPVERVLDVGDRATGTDVLRRLYARLALAPGTWDLPALWASLGVQRDQNGVHFDDRAPLSDYRRAISASSPGAETQTPLP